MVVSEFRKIEKPWGHERLLSLTSRYCLKEIYLKAGCRTSLQYHNEKMESIYVLSGTGVVEMGADENNLTSYPFEPGDGWSVMPLSVHRMTAVTDLTYHEVSTPELDDVVRISDDYNRGKT